MTGRGVVNFSKDNIFLECVCVCACVCVATPSGGEVAQTDNRTSGRRDLELLSASLLPHQPQSNSNNFRPFATVCTAVNVNEAASALASLWLLWLCMPMSKPSSTSTSTVTAFAEAPYISQRLRRKRAADDSARPATPSTAVDDEDVVGSVTELEGCQHVLESEAQELTVEQQLMLITEMDQMRKLGKNKSELMLGWQLEVKVRSADPRRCDMCAIPPSGENICSLVGMRRKLQLNDADEATLVTKRPVAIAHPNSLSVPSTIASLKEQLLQMLSDNKDKLFKSSHRVNASNFEPSLPDPAYATSVASTEQQLDP